MAVNDSFGNSVFFGIFQIINISQTAYVNPYALVFFSVFAEKCLNFLLVFFLIFTSGYEMNHLAASLCKLILICYFFVRIT